MISHNESQESVGPGPKFCDQCGKSLIPLDRPHVARECTTCGKTIHLVEQSEEGGGIYVRAGDRFTIPAGFIRISLDPSVGWKLCRPGLHFLMRQLFFGTQPGKPEDLGSTLKKYRKEADRILEASDLLKDLNPESEADAEIAWKRLSEKQDRQEWWAMLSGSFCGIALDAMAEGDSAKAGWATFWAAHAHAMVVATERVFEETLWRGYLANQVVYDTAAAAARTSVEAEAIKNLHQVFAKYDEATLHTWLEDGRPIAPRIGVTALPEETVRALAQWHLANFERRRAEAQRERDEQKERRELIIKSAGAGAGVVSALAALLKALGFL